MARGIELSILAALLLAATLGFAADGFEPIFNGRNLDGWELYDKSGKGYVVEEGLLRCPPGGGGNLFYDQELSDFVLRFEFRLEDGSNNGLCIRCPKGAGSKAYEGMELQIIDNNAERYAEIKPWQKHGSLYHVFPAKTGALKAPGEWNTQEVAVLGRHVKVTLNDETILDVDLDDVTNPEILEKHPGLQRESGYIGLLGHDEPIAFRNFELKPL